MGNFICSQHPSGIDDLNEKQRLTYLRTIENAKSHKLTAQMSGSPRTAQQLRSAFYGMGDFMSGSSDSDPKLMFKIGFQRENHYQKRLIKFKKHKMVLTQFVAGQRRKNQRSLSFDATNKHNRLDSGSDSNSNSDQQSKSGKKSLGRVCREFQEAQQSKKHKEEEKKPTRDKNSKLCIKCHKRRQNLYNLTINSATRQKLSNESPHKQKQSQPQIKELEYAATQVEGKPIGLLANIRRKITSLGGVNAPLNKENEVNPFGEKVVGSSGQPSLNHTFKPASWERNSQRLRTGKKSRGSRLTYLKSQSGQKYSNGFTFSDKDVEVESHYGGGIICGKQKIFDSLSERLHNMGCCDHKQLYEPQNSMDALSSYPRTNSNKKSKIKKKQRRAVSECNSCQCCANPFFSDQSQNNPQNEEKGQKRKHVRSAAYQQNDGSLSDCHQKLDAEEEIGMIFQNSYSSKSIVKSIPRHHKTFKSSGDLIREQIKEHIELQLRKEISVMSEEHRAVSIV